MFTVVASMRRPCGSGATLACGAGAAFGLAATGGVFGGTAAEALAVAACGARTGFGKSGSAAWPVLSLMVRLPDSSLISVPSLLTAGRAGRADRIRPPAPAYSGNPISGSESRYPRLMAERADSARTKAPDQIQQRGGGEIAVGQNRPAVGRPVDLGPGHTHGGVVPGEAKFVGAVVLVGDEVEELQRFQGQESMGHAGGDRDRLGRAQFAHFDDGMSGWVGQNRPHVYEGNERSATHDGPVVELAARVVQPAKDAGRGRGEVRLNEAGFWQAGLILGWLPQGRGSPDLDE